MQPSSLKTSPTINTKQSVLEALLQITDPDDLSEIRDHAEFLSRQRMNNETPVGLDFWMVLTHASYNAYSLRLPNLYMIKTTPLYSEYRKSFAVLDDFQKTNFPNMTGAKLKRLYTLFAKLLLDEIQNWPVGPTAKNLTKAVTRIPALFELNFPGYIAAGLQNIIIRKAKTT